MECELINILEYLAIGEIEAQLSQDYPHQDLFSDPIERQLILQAVLNQMPPVYRWVNPCQCPDLGQLAPDEQIRLRKIARQQIEHRLHCTSSHHSPYCEAMPEMFYG